LQGRISGHNLQSLVALVDAAIISHDGTTLCQDHYKDLDKTFLTLSTNVDGISPLNQCANNLRCDFGASFDSATNDM
jgi:hypothetical protein